MKIFCSLIIIISSYLFGTYLSRKYRYRENDISSVIDCLSELLRQITVYKRELGEALKASFGYEDKNRIILLIQNEELFRYIKKEEKSYAVNFLKECGKSNAEFERRKTEDCILRFKEFLIQAKKERKDKNKLCKTVCICLGMAVSVIII